MVTNNTPNDWQAALQKALDEQSFESIEEALTYATQFMESQTERAFDYFHGLTSAQMHQLLYEPFECPELIEVPTTLAIEPEAPIVRLLLLLFEGIGIDGLKPTATGNLPRNFCREAAQQFLGDEGYAKRIRYGGINQELDFFEMHLARVIAQDVGLVRRYKGRFILSRQCQALRKKNGMRTIYPMILRQYVERLNWDYITGTEAPRIIQTSCLFTMYLLTHHGQSWRPHVFYVDAFLGAFPVAIEQMPPEIYISQEDSLRQAYFYRTLYHFAYLFGLAEVESTSDDFRDRTYRIKATPLLSQAVRFLNLA